MSKKTMHLREYFEKFQINKKKFAESIGINIHSIQYWIAVEGGRHCVNPDNLQALYDATGGLVDANSMFNLDTSEERLRELKKANTAKNNLTGAYNGHF